MSVKKKFNKQVFGLLIGFLVPALTSYLIFHFRYTGAGSYIEFLVALLEWSSLGKLLSLSVLPNLMFFFFAIRGEYLYAARGILMATVIYGLIGVVIFLSGS